MQVSLEEFTQQYICHILDIQTERLQLNQSFKYFNPEKDRRGLIKFLFQVLSLNHWCLSTIVKSDVCQLKALIEAHTVRCTFPPPLSKWIHHLPVFPAKTGKLRTILSQNKFYRSFWLTLWRVLPKWTPARADWHVRLRWPRDKFD